VILGRFIQINDGLVMLLVKPGIDRALLSDLKQSRSQR
jgi:hypothetical protein